MSTATTLPDGPTPSKQFEHEQSHTRTRFQRGYVLAQVAIKNLGGILRPAPERRDREISQPPRADRMRHAIPPGDHPISIPGLRPGRLLATVRIAVAWRVD